MTSPARGFSPLADSPQALPTPKLLQLPNNHVPHRASRGLSHQHSSPLPSASPFPRSASMSQRIPKNKVGSSIVGSTVMAASAFTLTPADVEQSLADLLDGKEENGARMDSELGKLETTLEELLTGIGNAWQADAMDQKRLEAKYNQVLLLLSSLIETTQSTGLGSIPITHTPLSLVKLRQDLEESSQVAFGAKKMVQDTSRAVGEVMFGSQTGDKGKGR